MRQLQDKQRIVYIQDDDGQHYEVIHVRRPRAARRPPVEFYPFWLGLFAVVLLTFVVKDVDWLIQRSAAALAILLMAGVFVSIAGGFWLVMKDVARAFFWWWE
jgi:hypothetical protein